MPPPRPPLPVRVLALYPAALLLGGLFSVISPTARGSNIAATGGADAVSAVSTPGHTPGSSVPISPPVNYFAGKRNAFNVYFVKVGWAWTTAAFVALLLTEPAFVGRGDVIGSGNESIKNAGVIAAESSSSASSAPDTDINNNPFSATNLTRRFRQAILRFALITSSWLFTTQWAVGPPLLDRMFTLTGGRCEGRQRGGVGADGIEELGVSTAANCRAAHGHWTGGHDSSGHVLMLVLTTALLTFEWCGAQALGKLQAHRQMAMSLESLSNDDCKADSQYHQHQREHQKQQSSAACTIVRPWARRLVLTVIALGWWMLLMTAIFFHTWREKVRLVISHTRVFIVLTL